MKFPKSTLAKRLGIARSTLCYRSKKTDADEEARTLIEEVMIGNPAYGHKRVAIELGWNKKKALRLMKKFGLKPRQRRGQKWQKKGDMGLEPASYENLVSNWCPIEPDVVWFADFTYLKVRDSFLYLETVIDGHTKEVLGFAISRRHNRKLVKEATLEAIAFPAPIDHLSGLQPIQRSDAWTPQRQRNIMRCHFITRRPWYRWSKDQAIPAKIEENAKAIGIRIRHQCQNAVGLGNRPAQIGHSRPEADCEVP
jgi:transposase InsO family protein